MTLSAAEVTRNETASYDHKACGNENHADETNWTFRLGLYTRNIDPDPTPPARTHRTKTLGLIYVATHSSGYYVVRIRLEHDLLCHRFRFTAWVVFGRPICRNINNKLGRHFWTENAKKCHRSAQLGLSEIRGCRVGRFSRFHRLRNRSNLGIRVSRAAAL
ncbi:unnamed protein product [Ixodes pacificus]